ncbi:MAG TPA: PRC-barrel domain-containing protein [Burkholderiales bacterium]|nr:PRC-barrel domain-containing protein [Burkholderiales bacterium]
MLPRKFKRSLIAMLVAPALAVPAAVMAQQQQKQQQPQPQTQAQPQQQQAQPQQRQQQAQMPFQMQQNDKRASRLIGMDVRSPKDENLGEIKDLVIDTQSGRVEYVALAHGGFLGLGQDLYAYPLNAFQPAKDRDDRLVLNVTREQLKQAQGFDANDWPKVREDRGFWARITDTFGGNRDRDRTAAGATAQDRPAGTAPRQDRPAAGATAQPQQQQHSQVTERQPAGASQQAQPVGPQAQAPRDQAQRDRQEKVNYVRASDMKGQRVRDQKGGNLGQVEDLIVNMSQGEVRYAIIDTAGDDRMVAVSMQDLTVRRDNGDHVVQFTKDKLDLSKSFSQQQWRDMDRGQRAAAGGTAAPRDPAAPGAAGRGNTAAPAAGERTAR